MAITEEELLTAIQSRIEAYLDLGAQPPADLLELRSFLTTGVGGAPGSGITQSQVRTAIETASTLDQIEAKLDALLAQLQSALGEELTTPPVPGFVGSAALQSASILLPADPSRKLLVITNTSNAIVYVRLGAVAPTSAPGGFAFRILVDGSLELSGSISKLEVRVIAPGATANLSYIAGT